MQTLHVVSPTPLRASKPAISSFAERVGKQVEYTAGASMHELVVRLNGRICYKDTVLPDNDSPEAIVVQPDRSFQIFLPTVTSPERDRFTIAHELGHFFLHFPAVSKADPKAVMRATRRIDDADDDQRRSEWEANWFAASFLMPADEFQSRFAHGLPRLAAHFGVSLRAAEVRAQSLGLGI